MASEFAIITNYADASTVTLTASSGLTGNPVSNLQNKHVMRTWIGRNGTTENITIDFGASPPAIDAVAMLNLVGFDATAVTRLRASNTDTSGQAGEMYDSTSAAGRVDGDYRALIFLLSSQVTARYWRIDLNQGGLTRIEAGRLAMGQRQAVSRNFSVNWQRGWKDPTTREENRDGQEFEDIRDPYRTAQVSYEFLVLSERNGFVEQIDRDLGTHGDFLWIEDPTSSNLGRDCIWGHIDGDNAPVIEPAIFQDGNRVFSKTYRIRERR